MLGRQAGDIERAVSVRVGAGAQFLAIHALIRRSSCEYPKVQRGPSHVLTKRLRALQSVRFRAWAGTLVIGSHVLRLAPRVQRISMPRSPLSKIKVQGGCERSVCFHQKLCESRRRAARADILFVPIFLMALFSSFQEFLRLSWRVELSQYLFDECSDLCIGRTLSLIHI